MNTQWYDFLFFFGSTLFIYCFSKEIDGHSLLLLTVQEIHHILGVKLGPAMKLHDLVYSLQQVVNEAFIASKKRVLSSKTSR